MLISELPKSEGSSYPLLNSTIYEYITISFKLNHPDNIFNNPLEEKPTDRNNSATYAVFFFYFNWYDRKNNNGVK